MAVPITAFGLPADWLNGWLAALGVTVLLPDIRLGWTSDATPLAQFEVPSGSDLPTRVAAALPKPADLLDTAIASASHNVNLQQFERLAERARETRDPFLAASVTDLVRANADKLPRGGFDPPAQQGRTLFARFAKCRESLPERPVNEVSATLEGRGSRIAANGLGFDYRRLRAAVVDAEPYVDPVVECLCFVALELLPVRGSGGKRAQTRGWIRGPLSREERFVWPAWGPRLDRWAIDALLDQVHARPEDASLLRHLGVHAVFGSLTYRGRGASDVSTGYASQRLW